MVGGGLNLVIHCFTRVRDVGNKAGVSIDVVGHGLDATVGKGNLILALGGGAVTTLGMAIVGSGIVVLDRVAVLVKGGLVMVDRCVMVSGRSRALVGGFMVSQGSIIRSSLVSYGGAEGNSSQSGEVDEGLENTKSFWL